MTSEDVENTNIIWKTLDLGSHVDLCNVTEITRKHNLGNLFAMTWRWVYAIYNFIFNFSFYI